MQKSNIQSSFSDLAVHKRKIKKHFFEQLNKIVDWQKIDATIKHHYNKGLSVDGRSSYSGLVLFKMSLLQTWYGLSDYEVEAQVNDSLSFMLFTGLSIEDAVPDHSVLSRFRTALTASGTYEILFEEVNRQLEQHKILVKKGVIVDASITVTERKPKGKKVYEIVEDRCYTNTDDTCNTSETEDETSMAVSRTTVREKVQSGVDTEAKWVKKGGKIYYGYKKHISVDDEHGLVTSVITTAANESDMQHIDDVAKKARCAKGTKVKADKGYQSQANKEKLRTIQLRPQIMCKAKKGKELTHWEKKFNRLVSNKRYKIERTFAGMKRWFGAGTARYIGKAKTHTQHLIESIAYNLYRSPKIACTIPLKETKQLPQPQKQMQ